MIVSANMTRMRRRTHQGTCSTIDVPRTFDRREKIEVWSSRSAEKAWSSHPRHPDGRRSISALLRLNVAITESFPWAYYLMARPSLVWLDIHCDVVLHYMAIMARCSIISLASSPYDGYTRWYHAIKLSCRSSEPYDVQEHTRIPSQRLAASSSRVSFIQSFHCPPKPFGFCLDSIQK